nr:helix-turn-helix domain-containing protein [uncultured Mucilaginibacter sp.]
MKSPDLAKKIKDLRTRKGLSQEQLADKAGLSLRTVQRIENGGSVPRGDILKRLALPLDISENELINQKTNKGSDILAILNLSQFSFIIFPLLGFIIPLAIWLFKKDKVEDIDQLAKAIINFQITWAIAFFLLIFTTFLFIGLSMFVIWCMYLFNIVIIITNTIKFRRNGQADYKPSFAFLK